MINFFFFIWFTYLQLEIQHAHLSLIPWTASPCKLHNFVRIRVHFEMELVRSVAFESIRFFATRSTSHKKSNHHKAHRTLDTTCNLHKHCANFGMTFFFCFWITVLWNSFEICLRKIRWLLYTYAFKKKNVNKWSKNCMQKRKQKKKNGLHILNMKIFIWSFNIVKNRMKNEIR